MTELHDQSSCSYTFIYLFTLESDFLFQQDHNKEERIKGKRNYLSLLTVIFALPNSRHETHHYGTATINHKSPRL